jgi:3-oxoadipate enol-lactonase
LKTTQRETCLLYYSSSQRDCRLDQIKCPTLIVVGDEDILSGLTFSEQLARGIRGSQLIVLEKCAHGLATESPEATVAAILDFLSRNPLSNQ